MAFISKYRHMYSLCAQRGVFPRLYRSESTAITPEESSIDPDLPVEMKNPFEKPKPQCILCKHKIVVSYKNVRLLSQFVSSFTGKLYGRHITGLCLRQQHAVQIEIQKAMRLAMIPGMHKFPIYLNDPKLFDPRTPLKII